ncbi:MAG: peptidoglycan editing factor PgeF [Deltaproteobacteria bacterium]|nr:peptidoglycan editing factor PgeF [Deltaproteobacteria bacterium]
MTKIVESPLFHLKSLRHGFLTRQFGSNPSCGIYPLSIGRVKQVHSDVIVPIEDPERLSQYATTEADGMVTRLSGIALTIVTADCLPILFYDPSQEVVAALHAGWRGTQKEISKKMVGLLCGPFQCDPQQIRVAIGPRIGACCYEVDQSVQDAFSEKRFFIENAARKGHWYLDLGKTNQLQLETCGVLAKNIWLSDLCTACHVDQFYSWRKEGPTADRQWSFIAKTSQKASSQQKTSFQSET